jgi:chloride channel 7
VTQAPRCHPHARCLAGVENIAGFKFWVTLTLLDRNQAFASYLVYVLINCSLIVGSVALTVLVAPAAAGSGIAEVKVRAPAETWIMGVALGVSAGGACRP